MAESYEGAVRILGDDGILLTTGIASLETDHELGTWKGVLQTLNGTAVAGKALVVNIEIPDQGTGKAQLVPQGVVGEKATSMVTGLGPQPF
ncbi:MAG TPA: hypothetical protein VG872_03950 [Acidimicrobiia bacterium]|jgi:hypothetical protein|nr:hypothetical protein [Acidimicrobiia bacterium]